MNALPILLLGGAAVLMMGGKKKASYEFKHLKIGKGCRSLTLGGEDVFEQLKLIQEDDESARQVLLGNMKLFWLEDMPTLILKVRPNPDVWSGDAEITDASLEKGSKKLMMAVAPSCYASQEALKNAFTKVLDGAKSAEDIEKKMMPLVAKMFVMVLIAGGYQISLIRDGLMDQEGLSDFEGDMMEGFPGWATGEGEGPTDPNQMAMTRAGFFTEAARQSI